MLYFIVAQAHNQLQTFEGPKCKTFILMLNGLILFFFFFTYYSFWQLEVERSGANKQSWRVFQMFFDGCVMCRVGMWVGGGGVNLEDVKGPHRRKDQGCGQERINGLESVRWKRWKDAKIKGGQNLDSGEGGDGAPINKWVRGRVRGWVSL